MRIDIDVISNLAVKYTTVPLITLVYLALTITLSAVTSYIRTQSYQTLLSDNPSLAFDDIIIPSLQLVPSHIVFHPWTLWTSTYVETSPLQFIFGIIIIYFGITFLESQWNPQSLTDDNEDVTSLLNAQKPVSETFKFNTFVVIVSNFICLLITSFIYILKGSYETLNHPLQYGLFILMLPLSVVAKQLTPERNIKVFSLFKFRLKRSPFILLCFALVLSIVKFSLSPILPAIVSFMTAWYYLRYLQLSPAINSQILPAPNNTSAIVRGDPSDTFSLVEFFPDLIKGTLKPVFDGFYQVAVLLGVVRPWNDDDVDIGNLRSNLRVSGASKSKTASGNETDERRKQIALKMLEQTVTQES
ncbi:hypothetical protein CANINC_001883 [Pichia inconspicua]|uniref:Uncharacterized protein n=1 Tax=Pichia inconspicua TaxID=52247 RepID=A0A4T0X2U9_9ASCO|nr:hypothetical protein CANINC_001883 [[Candida] inconspicua]